VCAAAAQEEISLIFLRKKLLSISHSLLAFSSSPKSFRRFVEDFNYFKVANPKGALLNVKRRKVIWENLYIVVIILTKEKMRIV